MLSSSSESKSTPRFGSLASPSSYRPSYSGGTYRSIGIRRDVPTNPSYSSRWLNSNKETLPKESIETKKSPAKTSPTDTTAKTTSTSSSKSTQIATASNLLNSGKTKVKEPLTLSRPPVTLAKVRIRDVNPSSSSYSAPKSRDPSPCEPTKDRYTSSSGYVSSSYSKLYPRSSNKLQVNSISNGRQSLSSTPAVSYLNGSDVGGRYRQNIDSNEKSTKTSSDESSSVSEIVNATANATTKTTATPKESSPSLSSSATATTTTTASSSSDSSDEPEPCVEMIEVTVVTRATSPNLCPSSATTTSFSRCRRAEIAKTIEKTIKRPKRWQHKAVDKEVQSDRMDDTSKYCRYSNTRATTPWPSSYMENRYGSMSYSRYNSNSSSNMASISKYSERSTKSEKDSNENSPEKNIEKEKTPSSKSSRESSISKSPSISRSNSIKSSSTSKSDKSKSKSPPSVPVQQQPAQPKSSSTSPTKQKLYTNKALPPQPPKLESPTKVISATASSATSTPSSSSQQSATGSKWANKDFRKSALNVGPTDRPRKARTSSTSTEHDECNKKAQQKPTTTAPTANQMLYNRSDRSPSVSSETSYSSGGNATDDMMKNNFIKLKISSLPTSPTIATAAATTTEATPTVTATIRLPTSPSANSNEVIHSNSDMMTYDTKSQPNIVTVIQPNDSSHSNNDSCTKIDNNNTKSTATIVNRVLGPVVKMFKTKSANQLGDSQSGSDHDSANSANESIKQDASLLNRTTNTSSGAKLVSSKNYLADESNSWIDSTVNEQTTDTQFDRFQSSSQSINNMKSPNSDNPPVSWWFQPSEPENDYTVADDITLNQMSDDETIRIDNNNLNGNNKNNNNNHGNNMADAANNNRLNPSIPWWMVDDTTTTTTTTSSIPTNRGDLNQKYRITHIRSGERAWWLDDDTEESVNDILEAAAENDEQDNDNDDNNNTAAKFTLKLKKVETGERSWWFCEENQDTEPNDSIKQTASSNSTTNNNKEKTPDIDFWASINESLEAEKMRSKCTARSNNVMMRGQQNDVDDDKHLDINANYIPLGDRASPEGLEDFNNNSDNFDASNVDLYFKKLFISKHKNIDEVLGAPCHALSPIRLDQDDDDEPFQEILPTQVRIHDGTAKTIHLDTERYVFLFQI